MYDGAKVGYAELHAHSAFSFLDGASQPEQMVAEAARLGLQALAITDHDGLYGVVRHAQAAREVGLATIFGSELRLPINGVVEAPTGTPDQNSEHLLVLARGPQGYRNLSRAIAQAHLAAGEKGKASYRLESLAAEAQEQWLILTGCRKGAVRRALTQGGQQAARRELEKLVALFGSDNVVVELTVGTSVAAQQERRALAGLAEDLQLFTVATTAAHFARGPVRPPPSLPLLRSTDSLEGAAKLGRTKPSFYAGIEMFPEVHRDDLVSDAQIATALAAVRANTSMAELAGYLPAPNAYLRSGAEMQQLFSLYPEAVKHTTEVAAACAFDLSLVAPNLPPYPVPPGHTEATWLRRLVEVGGTQRYGARGSARVAGAWEMLEHELAVIEQLGFPGYFLIVYDLVEFCRTNGIMCQGRGSAANSAVCYALGITAVDAVRHGLLFERFLAPERDGPPDIDLDIEAKRREEVIQHVYQKFGRTHAAQVANVISYRPRSAVRDAAKALGYDVGQQDAWAKATERWGAIRDSDDADTLPPDLLNLSERFLHLPRHLGIHSGGMVLGDRPVIEVCPVEWARMEGRTVLQWDKEDCADAGLVKFDLLGLGMLTAIRYAFEFIEQRTGSKLELHHLPDDDPAVYDLLCAADTVGLFQVESRAQMATLPRLKPRNFYDIVVEVALIRPGPIQGGSVHPYLNRRNGREEVTYLHPILEKSLQRTLGVPLFQEQLMQMAIDIANFSPAESDQLRRAMGSKRSLEKMEALRGRLMAGMSANGAPPAAQEQIYEGLKGFADFGFPESHAYSFAFLVYASAWLKVHYPAEFFAALLGAQPLGFYSPQTLVADARRHGLTVLRPNLNRSDSLATVEMLPADTTLPPAHLQFPKSPDPTFGPEVDFTYAVREGLAQVRGISLELAKQLVDTRPETGYHDLTDLVRRVKLSTQQLENLATAGAFECFGINRREGLWAAGALAQEGPDTLSGVSVGIAAPTLPGMSEAELVTADAFATGITPDTSPVELVRASLIAHGVLTVAESLEAKPQSRVAVGGAITHRQRPPTAGGVTFLTLEDETGLLNVVCSPEVWDRHRKVARRARAMVIRGRVEKADGATNLVAEHLAPLALPVEMNSRDFQ